MTVAAPLLVLVVTRQFIEIHTMTKSARNKLIIGLGAAGLFTVTFAATHLLANESASDRNPSLHCQHLPQDCAKEEAGAEKSEVYTVTPAPMEMAMPLAPGQDMFGAISEINGIIEQSGMAWTDVDLDALWEHLRDMDALMIGAVVEKTELENGLSMIVSGEGAAARAVENMIPAHATFLRSVRPDWTIELEGGNARYEVVVTASNATEIERIKALGFSGFMVQDDHHATHHFDIASGEVVH